MFMMLLPTLINTFVTHNVDNFLPYLLGGFVEICLHFISFIVSEWSFLLGSNMSSEEGPVVGTRLHRLTTWFDPESAAVR